MKPINRQTVNNFSKNSTVDLIEEHRCTTHNISVQASLIQIGIPPSYLPLLENKVGAFDQVTPLQNWNLPETFAELHKLLQMRTGKKGKREFIQVLRLTETIESIEPRWWLFVHNARRVDGAIGVVKAGANSPF